MWSFRKNNGTKYGCVWKFRLEPEKAHFVMIFTIEIAKPGGNYTVCSIIRHSHVLWQNVWSKEQQIWLPLLWNHGTFNSSHGMPVHLVSWYYHMLPNKCMGTYPTKKKKYADLSQQIWSWKRACLPWPILIHWMIFFELWGSSYSSCRGFPIPSGND